MKTIENLGKMAKLNLCESCFQKYKMLIEPSIGELLFNPIDDWREVESNITQMVMITEGVFKGKIDFLYIAEDPYFIWGEENEWRLIKFIIKQSYNIDWIQTAKINRNKNNIKLSNKKNYLSLRLNDEKTKVSLKIDDGRTDEFIVKMESKNLKIYKEDIEGSNDVLGEEIKWEKFQKIKLDWTFTKKIDHLHTKRILRVCSYRVLKEANEVRNKIHDPSIVAPFSEQDLNLFHKASLVTSQILQAIQIERGEDISINLKSISTNLKKEAEEHAKQCLLELNLNLHPV